MSKDRIRELLTQLREEIRKSDVDDELDQLVSDIDTEIHGVIDDNADIDAVLEQAKKLEANFATSHPTAERVVREVIDLLVHMGI
jgi:chorismate mutase